MPLNIGGHYRYCRGRMRGTSVQFIMKSQESQPIHPHSSHDWSAEACEESSIHGMPYVARRDLHWTERVFWVIMVVASAYYAISSCLNQWERFRDNPIVYEYEYLFALRNFTFLGVTLCTNYESDEQVDQILNQTWGVNSSADPTKAAYYAEFLRVLNRLKYTTLDKLKPFENDTSLDNLPYLDILLKLQEKVLPPKNHVLLAPIITEVGLCQTTSQLTRFGNPYGKIEDLNVTAVRQCGFFSECQIMHKPFNSIMTHVFLYLHDVHEMMLPHDLRTVTFDAKVKSSYVLKLLVHSISADTEVRNLPVAYRKCRYNDENNLEYYSPYYPSLCRLECRIKWALSLCNCKPYFYVAAPNAPICNISGMLCLARSKWLEKPCDCFPLCRENTYNIIEEDEQSGGDQNYVGEQFERTMIIKMGLPKMGMKRRVVFSTDQLIMSFGGAIGLFLGASFMTIYGLIYLSLNFLATNIGLEE
ncbi:sodium channel protein Nach [Drosophila rhopaloa]|uniref:Sodium channel protein Nach n=1 Tax=Drosophila rhopaloa TaxID=1041015 RepID=A0A6P4EUG6_DRORH|nr:sodium channel protein Nach [Drosophila rhopaloa]